jgi:predicted nucleotidyltransferase
MPHEEIIKIIRRFISNLYRSGISIDKAILYGSYARNEANEDSDIDIMLVSSFFDTDDDEILSRPWSLELREDHRIEPYSVGLKKFESGEFSPILDVIEKEGIEIRI